MRCLPIFCIVIMTGAVSAVNSWAGTNSYFLQGMFEGKHQIDHIKELAANGVKVLRLWVRHQNRGCEKGTRITWPVPPLEETLGVYNDQTLDLLDQTLNLIRQHGNGMKVIISPHDANSVYPVGQTPPDPYTRFGHDFYTNEDAQRFFDARLRRILEYKGKYTGQVWKNFHEMIIGFDLQNEPYVGLQPGTCGTSLESDPAAADWMCKRARFIRNDLLGADNPIKIITGGMGGALSNGCTLFLRTLQCPELDVVAIHVYPGSGDSDLSSSTSDWKAWSNGKLLLVEELGFEWRGTDRNIIGDFKAATDSLNDKGVPWLAWSIIPDPARGCEKNYDDDKDNAPIPMTKAGVDFKSAMEGASNAEQFQNWGL